MACMADGARGQEPPVTVTCHSSRHPLASCHLLLAPNSLLSSSPDSLPSPPLSPAAKVLSVAWSSTGLPHVFAGSSDG